MGTTGIFFETENILRPLAVPAIIRMNIFYKKSNRRTRMSGGFLRNGRSL
jgi:hypothetical protein